MPFKVQSLLPSIGLELYQLGVHILAKKNKKKTVIPRNSRLTFVGSKHVLFYLLHSKYCVSFKIVLHRHLNDFIKIYLTTEQ